MQLTSNDVPDHVPARPTRGSRARPLVGRRRPSHPMVSTDGLLACLAVTVGGLGATAAIGGGLRVADLIITGLVMVGLIVLAMRDSRYLPVAVIATWVFAPEVRRIVDWQSGGFLSITALSLLPMMSTATLIAPTLNRLGDLPPRIRLPILMFVGPVFAATAVGVFVYGPSAIVEAGDWSLPVLAGVYFAARPIPERERWWMIRATVIVSSLAAIYGIYQYFFLPMWDALWLVQSGMTSSMGKPVPMGMHICGPMNFNGTAASVWSLVLMFAVVDREFRPALRFPAIAVLTVALCLTFVRAAWIGTAVGIAAYAAFSGAREGIRAIVALCVASVAVVLGASIFPVGAELLERFQTFGQLDQDSSFQARNSLLSSMVDEVAAKPWGTGLGAKTTGKVAGTTVAVAAVDNGYGDVLLTLGLLGGTVLLIAFTLVFVVVRDSGRRGRASDQRPPSATAHLTQAVIASLAIGNCAGISFVGPAGILMWLCIGISVSPRAAIGATDGPLAAGLSGRGRVVPRAS